MTQAEIEAAVLLYLWVMWSIACGFLAERYRRNGPLWSIAGLLLSPVAAAPILLALGPRADEG